MSQITKFNDVFVNEYPKLKELYDIHERQHWLVDEIDMRKDMEQWRDGTITQEEKAFIKMILRSFTSLDTDVAWLYQDKILGLFKHPDARMVLFSIAAREVTHGLAYKNLNDTLGYDSEAFMLEFLQYKEMREKHEYYLSEFDTSTPEKVAEFIVRQCMIEGVSLFGSFAMLLLFSKSGKLPGMVVTNKYSVIDESTHLDILTELFKIFVAENPNVVTNALKKAVYDTAELLVDLEEKFIDLCYSVGSTGTSTPEEIKNYVKYICNRRLKALGFKEIYPVNENPLEFMESILSNNYVNFFENTSQEYSKSPLIGEFVY